MNLIYNFKAIKMKICSVTQKSDFEKQKLRAKLKAIEKKRQYKTSKVVQKSNSAFRINLSEILK